MKKIKLAIEYCGDCPYAQSTENGEYPNAGYHCQNDVKLYENIEKNGFKGIYENDMSYIGDYFPNRVQIDKYLHPNCPLEDL